VGVVVGALGTVHQNLVTRWAGEPNSQALAATIRQVLDVVSHRTQQ
jgi:hypothetical protein